MFIELKQRWKAEEPVFFQKLITISKSVCGGASAVWLADSSMHLNLPGFILTACKYLIAFSAASGLTAKMTKE